MKLLKGGNTIIESSGLLSVEISWKSDNDLDVSSFLVNSSGLVPSDDYMVFYNQLKDPEGSVFLFSNNRNSVVFHVNLLKLSSEISKVYFTSNLEGSKTFKDLSSLSISVKDIKTDVLLCSYDVIDVSSESALVLCELYRNKSNFKFRAIGSGFNGGLKPLAESFGVVISEDSEEPVDSFSEVTKSELIDSENLSTPVNLSKIDLLKKEVKISLSKNNLTSEKSRVGVVIDASGSMNRLYKDGVVQRAFERVLAVASCMDDDGELDVWFFGSRCKRTPSVTSADFEDYIKNTYPYPNYDKKIGFGNNEVLVIKDVLKKYVDEEPRSDIPTFIIFFSDGGVYNNKEIKKLITECSNKNVFWQFVGIGKGNFGILEDIDNLPNRYLDNANFFSLSDLDSVNNSDLYNRLFSEFPAWLSAAKSKGIITN